MAERNSDGVNERMHPLRCQVTSPFTEMCNSAGNELTFCVTDKGNTNIEYRQKSKW